MTSAVVDETFYIRNLPLACVEWRKTRRKSLLNDSIEGANRCLVRFLTVENCLYEMGCVLPELFWRFATHNGKK